MQCYVMLSKTPIQGFSLPYGQLVPSNFSETNWYEFVPIVHLGLKFLSNPRNNLTITQNWADLFHLIQCTFHRPWIKLDFREMIWTNGKI